MRILLRVLCAGLLLVSCQDNLDQINGKHDDASAKKEMLPLLSFHSKKSLDAFVHSDDSSKLSLKTRSSDGFVSLMSIVDKQTLDASGISYSMESADLDAAIQDSITYYELLGYDKLIPNEELAATLNINGEIMVNDTIYKVSTEGTYYYPASSRAQVQGVIEDLPSGQQEDDFSYRITDQVKRYDTFQGGVLDDTEIITRQLAPADICWNDGEYDGEYDSREHDYSGGGGGSGSSSSEGSDQIPEPDYASFDTVSAGRHTFVGGVIDKLLSGPTKYHHRYYSSTKRLSARLYGYDYKFYSEEGVSVKFQKLPWYQFWRKTRGDELRASWRNIVLERKINRAPLGLVEMKQQDLQSLYYRDGDVSRISAGGKVNCYKLFYYLGDYLDLSTKQVNKICSQGFEQAMKLANNQYGTPHIEPYGSVCTSPTFVNKYAPKDCILVTKDKMYIFIQNDEKIKYDSKSLHRIFNHEINWEINASFDPSNIVASFSKNLLMDLRNTVSDNLKNKNFHLVNGEAVVCGRRGIEWKGLVIKMDD